MPKRASNRRGGGRTAKRRRHLYLVMDDWISRPGYSLHKVDLSPDLESDDDDAERPHRRWTTAVSDDEVTGQRLPPAFLRLMLPSCGFFAAFGTKIMAASAGAAHVFDVGKRCLTLGPRPNRLPTDIYVPVGDKLVALGRDGSAELLCPVDDWEWSWRKLKRPPFNKQQEQRVRVRSHAVHPDARTVFVSAESGTFTLDTESLEWKRHGRWKLPFTGRAHFDGGLDAWVGLSGDPDSLGYLCSCDVASADAEASDGTTLAWKLSKEKLFNKNPDETHRGAKLVCMGGRGRFCLVECFTVEDDDVEHKLLVEEDDPDDDRSCRHLLRLTTFSLKYGKDGDLLATTHGRVRSYRMPVADFMCSPLTMDPVAFWM